MTLKLSVLDLVPVRTDQTSGDALRATLRLAAVADDLGLHRYWLAEHHNMPAVAATNPPVLIAMVAAATSRIRVGSGGVMLPNHAPLVVAEQFGLLEAAYPGRIDLGLGRAPGSDPVTSWALRYGAGGVEDDAAARFPEYVGHVIAMLGRDGVGLDVRGRTYPLRATPVATSTPPVWLLGSSDFSARLAAEQGLPYVFAHHFSGNGTAEALALYRDGFRPAAEGDRPTTFLTANVVVAASDEEAERLARPQLLAMLALRTGGELGPQLLVEEAEAARRTRRARGPVRRDAPPLAGRRGRPGGGGGPGARGTLRRRRGDGAPGRRRPRRHGPGLLPGPRGVAPAAQPGALEAGAD